MSWTQYAEAASHLVSQKLGMTSDDYKPDYTRSTVDHFAIHAGQEKGGGGRGGGGGGGRGGGGGLRGCEGRWRGSVHSSFQGQPDMQHVAAGDCEGVAG